MLRTSTKFELPPIQSTRKFETSNYANLHDSRNYAPRIRCASTELTFETRETRGATSRTSRHPLSCALLILIPTILEGGTPHAKKLQILRGSTPKMQICANNRITQSAKETTLPNKPTPPIPTEQPAEEQSSSGRNSKRHQVKRSEISNQPEPAHQQEINPLRILSKGRDWFLSTTRPKTTGKERHQVY